MGMSLPSTCKKEKRPGELWVYRVECDNLLGYYNRLGKVRVDKIKLESLSLLAGD